MPGIEFSISSRLASSVDLEQLQSALEYLVGVFRADTPKVIPTSITQPPEARHILRLTSKLREVEDLHGFAKHARAYLSGVESAFFVACLAAHFKAGGVSAEFEPRSRKPRHADLAVSVDALRVFFECKSPISPLADIAKEQLRLFDALAPYLTTPHAITLRHRNPLSADDIRRIGEAVRHRLPEVRQDGVFLTQGDVEVSIDTTTDPAPRNISMHLVLTAPDPDDNAVMPGLFVARKGKKLAIYGPATNSSDVLVRHLEKAKKQAPLNAACVVAVSSNTLLGSSLDQRRAILDQFQPNKNRRISGVLIADFPATISGSEQHRLRFIANTYAKFPVPPALRALLGGQ